MISGYRAGPLLYHIYCDRKEIPEEQWAPISSILLFRFTANLAGTHAGTTVRNYVDGIRAWHGVLWERNKAQSDALPPETSAAVHSRLSIT
jgi:hypothetical protein